MLGRGEDRRGALGLLGALALLLAACESGSEASLEEQGRRTYQAYCIACHNADPAREGTVGPALSCSPADLIEARVLRAEYPPGYTPRRDSSLMPAQPFLKRELPGLAAYLACP